MSETTSEAQPDNSDLPREQAAQSDLQADHPPAMDGRERKRKLTLILVAAAVIAIAIVGVVVALLVTASQPSKLQSAAEECSVENSAYATVGDKGKSLTLDMQGEDDLGGLTYAQISCVLSEVNIPDSVTSVIGETRALDGRQTAAWDNLTASWSYHPDSGLAIILVED